MVTSAFIKALNWEEPQTKWREVVLKAIFKSSANGRIPSGTDNYNEFSFMRLLKDIEHFAAKYKAETGRPTSRTAPRRPPIWISTRWSLCALMERHQSGWKGSSDCKLVNAIADIPAGRSAWSRGAAPGGKRRIGRSLRYNPGRAFGS